VLAAIGRHYGWSRAELEALSMAELRFWAATVGHFNEASRNG
jgi:hypothetical protein